MPLSQKPAPPHTAPRRIIAMLKDMAPGLGAGLANRTSSPSNRYITANHVTRSRITPSGTLKVERPLGGLSDATKLLVQGGIAEFAKSWKDRATSARAPDPVPIELALDTVFYAGL